jgi:VIT1/CCC1 family predicted Fe2+/Mn2+ transporter
MKAQREVYEHEIEVERRALIETPEVERRELESMFVERGIDRELAHRLSVDLMRDPDLALRTHAREELGIDPSATGSPWTATLWSFSSFSLGALIPLLPWIVTSTGQPVTASVAAAAVGAVAVGTVIGGYTRGGRVRWALRQLLIAAGASGVTYLLGHIVGR